MDFHTTYTNYLVSPVPNDLHHQNEKLDLGFSPNLCNLTKSISLPVTKAQMLKIHTCPSVPMVPPQSERSSDMS